MTTSDNAIQQLAARLRSDYPDARVSVDRPRKTSGVWFVDVDRNGHYVQVQWRAKSGFGVSSSATASYGEGPDEVYQDSEAARHRVLSLLLSRGETSPPAPVRLAKLRRELGVSQIELAELLNVQQGALSRMERREDIKISSLREYCRKLGCDLELLAKFPNGEVRRITLDEKQDARAS